MILLHQLLFFQKNRQTFNTILTIRILVVVIVTSTLSRVERQYKQQQGHYIPQAVTKFVVSSFETVDNTASRRFGRHTARTKLVPFMTYKYRFRKQQQLFQQQERIFSIGTTLHQAIDENDSDDDKNNENSGSSSSNNNIDIMRQLLENVWNKSTMGEIPTTPDNAVYECVQALRRYYKNSDTHDRLFYIDILLPQYDIEYNNNKVYDEILITEFCIQFIQQLQVPTFKNSVVLYKDHNTVQSIQRIINARYNNKIENNSIDNDNVKQQLFETNNIVGGAEEEVRNDDIFYSDFDDLAVVDEENDNSNSSNDDIDTFRKSLIQSWSSDKENNGINENDAKKSISNNNPNEEQLLPALSQQQPDEGPLYRILSLFNKDVQISNGVDMEEDVINALKLNDNLLSVLQGSDLVIFVSSMTKEEMIAIRAILMKYTNIKMILFMNCKIDLPYDVLRRYPKPIILYSILPLIGQIKTSLNENINLTTKQKQIQPKIVVLRRYPNDWEVYVDLGSSNKMNKNIKEEDRIGFECIASISDDDIVVQRNQNRSTQQSASTRRGPSMEWIQSVVQKYIQNQQQQNQ